MISLLGLLGALDPYRHKVNLGKIGGEESAGAVLSMFEPSGDRYDRAGKPLTSPRHPSLSMSAMSVLSHRHIN